jgi:hypothetical protein
MPRLGSGIARCGRGSKKIVGQVVKGIRDGLHEVALKISRSRPSQDLLLREMAVLKSCRNSNIVQVPVYFPVFS